MRRPCAHVLVRLILPLLAALGATPPDPHLVVTGTVESPAGKAGLADVRVELLALQTSFAAGEGILAGGTEPEPAAVDRTDPAGRYRLRAPAPGLWRVRVLAAGSVPLEYRPLPLVESVELPPVAAAALADPLRVRLLHPDGRAAAGMWVFAESAGESLPLPGGWRPAFRRVLTGPSGEVEIPAAPGEDLRLLLFGAGHFGLPVATAEGRFTLPVPRGGPRRLRIRDEAGLPLPGLLVRAGPFLWPVAETDAAGVIELPVAARETVGLLILDGQGRRHPAVLPPWDEAAGHQTIEWPAVPWVRGRVLDAASRRPVAGALVWTGLEPGTATLTDPEGRYRLPAPSQVRFWLQADAAGFRPQTRWLERGDVESGRGPTLALELAGGLGGRVVDALGAAVAGVVLHATAPQESSRRGFFRPDPADARAYSDAAGRFELAGLAPGGAYRLGARKQAYLPEQLEVRAPGRDAGKALRIVLHADRPAFGRVVDPDDRPVADAEVHLLAAGDVSRHPPEISRRRTDSAGRFETPSLPGRRIDLRVACAGYAPTLVRGLEAPEGGGAVNLGVITLLPGASLEGLALDPDGEAAEGVEVYVLEGLSRDPPGFDPRSFEKRRAVSVSADDGRFRVSELHGGHPVSLLLLHPDYLPLWLHGVEAPRESPIVARLEPALGLEGEIVDPSGAAISGALVIAEWSERLPEHEGGRAVGPGRTRTARSNGEGRFRLSALEPGPLTLLVSAEGFVAAEPLEILLAEENPAREPRIVLEPGALLDGRVLTASGEPVSGARISAGGPAGVSDGDGVYRIGELALGETRLTLTHSSYRTQSRTVEIEAGDNALDWRVPDGVPLSGTVRSAEGEEISGAAVELSGGGLEYRARSDAGGVFSFDAVAAGSYSLRGEAEGFAPGVAPGSVEIAEAAVEDLVLTLEAEGRVHGEVRGLDFDRLAAVRVIARDVEGRSRTARLDYRGRYEIDGLGAGVWELRADLEGGRKEARERILLRAGETVRRDLEFTGGLVLAGRVRYGGEPAEGARVSLRGEVLDVRRTIVTNHEGGFRLEELEPDTYHLGLSDPRRFLIHNETLRLDADREILLDLDTGRLQGRVTDAASGEALGGALLSLRRQLDADGVHEYLITHGAGEDGSFDVVRIPPGLYAWTARRDGYAQGGDLLEMTAGGAPAWLEIALEPTRGLAVEARLSSGRVPVQLHLEATDGAGRIRLQESQGPDPEGRFRFQTLPAGRWHLRLAAPGGALRAVEVEVPGPPLAVVLEEAAPLLVEVPALATADAFAKVEVLDSGARPLETLGLGGRPLRSWRLAAGRATVDGVPAGRWTLRIETPDGQRWEAPVTTDGRGRHRVVLE